MTAGRVIDALDEHELLVPLVMDDKLEMDRGVP
jgi:hypothetical protein